MINNDKKIEITLVFSVFVLVILKKLYILYWLISTNLVSFIQETKVIRVYETFAGIGAQHKAITNIKSKLFKVVKTSEWDARAIIAYSQIHHQEKFDKELIKIERWDDPKINKYLLERTFSLNSKVPGNPIRKDRSFKNALVTANIVNNNNPDITKVPGEELNGIDLLTYSFPCQGLSIANMGRDKGIKRDAKSTSNLIWQIHRMLNEAINSKTKLPKYLLMENVKNLLSPKHRPDFDEWLNFLKGIGYSTNTIILNGLNHGALQRRERVFAISVLNGKKISDVEFKKMFEEKFSNKLSIDKRKKMYENILKSSDDKVQELKDATPNDTPSRHRMTGDNHNLKTRKWQKGKEYTFNTLTTKQDRHPNIGMIDLKEKIKNKMHMRFITPREGYQIMGFTSEDFSKVLPLYEKGIITKEALYRQAGNSIVVSVLEDIFKYIEREEKNV